MNSRKNRSTGKAPRPQLSLNASDSSTPEEIFRTIDPNVPSTSQQNVAPHERSSRKRKFGEINAKASTSRNVVSGLRSFHKKYISDNGTKDNTPPEPPLSIIDKAVSKILRKYSGPRNQPESSSQHRQRKISPQKKNTWAKFMPLETSSKNSESLNSSRSSILDEAVAKVLKSVDERSISQDFRGTFTKASKFSTIENGSKMNESLNTSISSILDDAVAKVLKTVDERSTSQNVSGTFTKASKFLPIETSSKNSESLNSSRSSILDEAVAKVLKTVEERSKSQDVSGDFKIPTILSVPFNKLPPSNQSTPPDDNVMSSKSSITSSSFSSSGSPRILDERIESILKNPQLFEPSRYTQTQHKQRIGMRIEPEMDINDSFIDLAVCRLLDDQTIINQTSLSETSMEELVERENSSGSTLDLSEDPRNQLATPSFTIPEFILQNQQSPKIITLNSVPRQKGTMIDNCITHGECLRLTRSRAHRDEDLICYVNSTRSSTSVSQNESRSTLGSNPEVEYFENFNYDSPDYARNAALLNIPPEEMKNPNILGALMNPGKVRGVKKLYNIARIASMGWLEYVKSSFPAITRPKSLPVIITTNCSSLGTKYMQKNDRELFMDHGVFVFRIKKTVSKNVAIPLNILDCVNTMSQPNVSEEMFYETQTSQISLPNSYIPQKHLPDYRSIQYKELRLCIEDIEKNKKYDEKLILELNPKLIKRRIYFIFYELYTAFEDGRTPIFKVRGKENKSNQVFKDGKLQMKPVYEITPKVINFNSKQSRWKFCLMMYVLAKSYSLLESDKKITKREIFYQIKPMVRNQRQIDSAIEEVCCLLNVGPWHLNIVSHHGLVYGDLKILLSSEEIINCNVPGTLIPLDVQSIVEFKSNAKFILVVEKEAIFQKMISEDMTNTFKDKFILVTGKGFPDLNVQLFLKRLCYVMCIPVFILVDANIYGIRIMMQYRFGSMNSCYLADYLAVPDARWLGVFPTDIARFGLDNTKATERDRKLTRSVLEHPAVKDNPKLEEQLQCLLNSNRKADIESVVYKGKTYLSNTYLHLKFLGKNTI